MSRRWRYPRSRRGSFYGILPVSTTPTAPTFSPAFQEPSGRSSRNAALGQRRGRFFIVPRRVCPPVSTVSRTRVRLAVPRRGEFFTVPFVVSPAAPATWVPAMADPRRTPSRLARRGEFFVVPLVGVAPMLAGVPPLPMRSRRPQVLPTRRGRFLFAPCPRQGRPLRIVSRRASLLGVRRGQLWRVPWPVVPLAGPGPYIPRMITSPHRPPVRPIRRGIYSSPPWTGAALSCTTRRPDAGITSRPAAGVTSRPNTGTTARPCVLS